MNDLERANLITGGFTGFIFFILLAAATLFDEQYPVAILATMISGICLMVMLFAINLEKENDED